MLSWCATFIQYIFLLSENYCYCPKINECLKPSKSADEWLFEDCNQFCKSGLLQLEGCNPGLPVIMTWPHFWNADSALLDEIDGVRPIKQLHETYYDIHPITGYPISLHIRNQVTIYLLSSVIASINSCLLSQHTFIIEHMP